MIKGKKRVTLTTDAILTRISEYDIFRYYMPDKSFKLNVATYSPFRQENNPSFLIGTKKGYISFIDFADVNKRGDCFTFVKLLYNLSTHDDVLRMIDRDFGLGIASDAPTGDHERIVATYKQPELTKRNALIQVVTRKFNNEELQYWNQYHQSLDDLRANNVYAVKKLYLNKSLFFLKETELVFGYFYDGHWKIYRPYATRNNKWMPNNVPITAMDGKNDIINCRIAFINKSKKDHMVIKKVFPCSCAVQNEGIGCFSPENVEFLKANSDTQILSFDSDVTGVQNSQQITKLFDFGYCNVPKKYAPAKDWADVAKLHGLKEVEKILKQKQLL
jgi:DNA primase